MARSSARLLCNIEHAISQSRLFLSLRRRIVPDSYHAPRFGRPASTSARKPERTTRWHDTVLLIRPVGAAFRHVPARIACRPTGAVRYGLLWVHCSGRAHVTPNCTSALAAPRPAFQGVIDRCGRFGAGLCGGGGKEPHTDAPRNIGIAFIPR